MSEAIAVFQERLASNPTDVEAFEGLERALVNAHDIDAVCQLYADHEAALSTTISNYWMRLLRHIDQAVSREDDPERRGRLFLAIGRVYEEKLSRLDQANASYQQAYRVWPRLSEALDRARAIYSAAGNWDLVLRLWEMQGRNDREASAQADIFVAMGRVCLDHIGDGARASDFARRALTQVPDHAGAKKILEDYADLIRDWRSEVRVMQGEAEELPSTEAQIAALQETLRFVIERVPLEQAEGGPVVDALAERDPNNIESWLLARQWFDRADDAARAEEAHRALVGLYTGEERIEALREAARRAHAIDRGPQEIAARRGLLLDVPSDTENFTRLVQLAKDEGAREVLLEVYEDALEVGISTRAQLHRDALLLARELDALDRGETHALGLLEADPEAVDALAFLAERRRTRGEHAPLYEALVHWAPLAADDEAARLWEEAATLAEDALDRPDDAIDAWMKVRTLASEAAAPREAQRRLYRAVERWADLAAHLEMELKASAPIDTPAVLHRELSDLYTDRLDAHTHALRHLDALVALAPEDDALGARFREVAYRVDAVDRVREDLRARAERATPEARFPFAVALARLELDAERPEAAKPWLDSLIDHPDTELDLLRTRRSMAQQAGDIDTVIAVQDRLCARLAGTDDGVDELLMLAHLAEEAGRHELALDAARRALAVAGDTHESALAHERRALEALGDWAGLLTALQADIERSASAVKHERMAALAAGKLQDDARAVEHRRAALALDPSFEPSRDALIQHYASAGEWDALEALGAQTSSMPIVWEALFDAYEARIGALGAEGYAASPLPALYGQLNRIASTILADPARAHRAASLHARHQDDLESWEAAADIAAKAEERADEHRSLTRAAKHADASDKHADSARLWTRAAELAESQPELERDGWQERVSAWRATPSEKPLRDALAKASIHTQRIAEYAALLDEHLDRVDDNTRALFLRDLGSLTGGPLEDHPLARGYWAQLLELRPKDAEALQALHALYAPDTHPTELLGVLDARLALSEDPAESAAMQLERAELLDYFIEDAEAALKAWRVVEGQGGEARSQAHERMEALYRQTEAWTELEALFGERLGFAADEEAAAQAMCRRGTLRIRELQREDDGVTDLLNVLRTFANTTAANDADAVLRPMIPTVQSEVVDALMKWHEDADRRDVADAILEARVRGVGSQEPARQRVLVERLKDNEARQVDVIEYWIDLQLSLKDALQEAREMTSWARQTGRSADLAGAWSERLLGVESVPSWWENYVFLAAESPEDADRTLRVLRHLQSLDAAQAPAIQDAIEDLLGSVGRTDEHIQVLVARAEGEEGDAAAARYETAAELAELELADHGRAADLYQRAYDASGHRETLVPELVRNLLGAERWDDAAGVLRGALERSPASSEVGQWRAQLARVSSLAGEPDETVLAELRQAASLTPSAPAVGEGLRHLAFKDGVDAETARSAASLYLSLGVRDPELRRELHERILTLSPDAERRVPALLALGELLRPEEEHRRRAWDVYAEALGLAPARASVANALEGLAGELGAWHETSELFAATGAAMEGTEGVPLLDRAIRIDAEENEDLERATQHLETLLGIEGDGDERLAKLQGWYTALSAHPKVIATIDRRAKLAKAAGDRAHYHQMCLDAVEVADTHIQDHADTVARWREIVGENEAARMRGLSELGRLHRAEAEWVDLDATLTDRVAISEDQELRHTLLREQATLREEQKNLDGAIVSLSQITRENLEEVAALYELDRLYLATNNTEQRYQTIQERFGRSGRIEDRLELARAGLVVPGQLALSLRTLESLVTGSNEVRADALETLRDLADNQPDILDLPLWTTLAHVLVEERELAGAARANIAIAGHLEEPSLKRAHLWTAVEQRLESLDALEDAAAMSVTIWQEEGAPRARTELVKEVARRSHALKGFSTAAEAVLEKEPTAEWLRRELVEWYTEDEPSPDARRRHLQALFADHSDDADLYRDLLALTPDHERVPVLRNRLGATKDDQERQELRAVLGKELARSEDAAERTEAQQLLEAFRQTQSADHEVNQTLRQLLADNEQWWQLASLIEEELWLTDDSDARVKLLVERARCRVKEDALPSMLVEAWFDVLAEDAAQPEAILSLVELTQSLDDPLLIARVQDRLELAYEKSGRWSELYDLIQGRAAQLEGSERYDAWARAADIADKQLDDPTRAFHAYRQMLAANPADAAALTRAKTLAEQLEDLESLRSALDAGLEQPGLDAAVRAGLRREAALIRAAQPGRQQEAIDELSSIFDAHREWRIVEDAERIYEDDRDALTAWLEARADAVGDLDVRIRLLRHASEVLRRDPSDVERAGAVLEAIFLLRPTAKGAEELDALYKKAGLHNARVSFWSARIQDAEPILPGTALHTRLHETLVADEALWAEQIKHLNAWYAEVEALREDDANAARAPEEEARWRRALDDTIARWCKTADRAEREGDLLDALMKRAGTTDRADQLFKARVAVASSEERADRLWDDLVRQHAETISLQKAWETASDALRDAPERDARGATIERLAEQLENYEEAAALLRHVTRQRFDERYELAVRAARIDIHKLKLLERASTTLQQVLDQRPDHVVARQLLREVLEVATRGELRQRVTDTLIEIAIEPKEKASLAMVGTQLAFARGDHRDALAGARRALRYDPGHAETRAFLLERRTDPRWRDLLVDELLPVLRGENAVNELRLLVRALADSEPKAMKKAEYAAELAQLFSENTEQGSALSAWLAALHSHPHSPSYLENAVRAVSGPDDAMLLRSTLEEILENTRAKEVRAGLFAAIGRMELELLGDSASGEANLLQALEENPKNENALSGLETFYLDKKNYEGLASLLEARMRSTEDLALKRQLADRRVTLLRGELQRPNDAAAVLEEILALGGHDESLIDALRMSYREAKNIPGEVDTLERLAASATDIDERIDFRNEALKLALEDAKLEDRALALTEAILLDDAMHAEALVVRERILRQRSARPAVRDAQLALIQNHSDDEVAREVLRAALADPKDAGQKEEARALSRILATALDRQLFDVSQSALLAPWFAHIAVVEQRRIVHACLDAPASAESRPLMVAALSALRPSSDAPLGHELAEKLAEHALLTREEHRAIAQWYELSKQSPEAISAWEQVLELSEDDAEKAEVLMKIAQIEEGRENFSVLMPLYERVRQHGHSSAQLQGALERGFEREGRWEELLELLQTRAELAEAEERPRLLRRIAAIHKERFGDFAQARAVLEQAVHEGGDLSAQIELLEVLVATHEVDVADAMIHDLSRRDLRREMRHRVELSAGLLALHEGRWDDARVWLESARSHAASHASTLLNLAQAYIGVQAWGEAQEALQAALVNQDQLSSEEKATTFVLLARVQAQDGSIERAKELVTRALRLAPSLPSALELERELERIA